MVYLILVEPGRPIDVRIKRRLEEPQAAAQVRREAGDEHEEEEPIKCDAKSHELARLLLSIFLEELKNT